MLEHIKYKKVIKIVSLFFTLVFISYLLFFRGWIKKVDISKEEINSIFFKINQLDLDSFSMYNYENSTIINEKEYFVSYNQTVDSINVKIFSVGEEFLTFSICKKDAFQMNYDFSGIVSSEKEIKDIIKQKYGSIDLFYSFFSTEILTECGYAYFSPVSRVRSEIYSFTNEQNISGIFFTDKYIVAFSNTCDKGNLDLFYGFLNTCSKS